MPCRSSEIDPKHLPTAKFGSYTMFGVPFLIILKFGRRRKGGGKGRKRGREKKRMKIIDIRSIAEFLVETLTLKNINITIHHAALSRMAGQQKLKKPRPPKHQRSSRGGHRDNAGRPKGTKKQIPGQARLNPDGTIRTGVPSRQQDSPAATEVTENNENEAPLDNSNGQDNVANNGQEGRKALSQLLFCCDFYISIFI